MDSETKPSQPLNPFRYGKPVPPDRFVGRRSEVRTIFSRILNGESTAVIGEPHIGKSSLLRYIGHPPNRSQHLGGRSASSKFIPFDMHLLASSDRAEDFWRVVLERLESEMPLPWLQSLLEAARQKKFRSFAVEHLFRTVGEKDIQLVLLLDEFDSLLHHPGFGGPDFFGPLRSLVSNTDGLALVIASRLSVTELNRRTADEHFGSPFFNVHTEVNLPALRNQAEIKELLRINLEGTGLEFSTEDRSFLGRVAGRHPYVLQAAAAALFDAVVEGKVGGERYTAASRYLGHRTRAHFDDVWRHMPPLAQTAMAILALAEMNGQTHDRDFDTSALGDLDRYQPELERLEELGLVEKVGDLGWHADWGNFAVWRGRRWRVSVGSFVWWIADNAIASTRATVDFEKWLQDREFEGLLTRAEKEGIKELVGKVPESVLSSVGEVTGMFLKSFLKSVAGTLG